MSSFLSGIGKALRAPGFGDRLQAALAAAGGDTSALPRLRALQLQQADLQRQNDARDAQVIGAKNLGFSNDDIGAMSVQDLSWLARQRAASGSGLPPLADDNSNAVLDRTAVIQHAASAIQRGADPQAVRARLHELGHADVDPPGPFADLIPDKGYTPGMAKDSAAAVSTERQSAPQDTVGFGSGSYPTGSAQINRGNLRRRADPAGAPQMIGGASKYQSKAGSSTTDPAGAVGNAVSEFATHIAATGSRPGNAGQGRDRQPAAAWREGGRWSREAVEQRAAHAVRMYKIDAARGLRPEEAAGWAASSEAESGGDYRYHQNPGPGVGLYQWGSNNPRLDRRPAFQHLFGHPIEQSTENEQLAFRDWELANSYARAAARIGRAQTAGDVGDAITRYYEVPKERDRDAADRANVAEAIMRLMAQSNTMPRRTGQRGLGISATASGTVRQ